MSVQQPAFAPAPALPKLPAPHIGVGLGTYYGVHFLGAAPGLLAAVVFYGWRALLALALVLAGAAATWLAWRTVGRRGPMLRLDRTLWMATLLALLLPVDLLVANPSARHAWTLAPAGGGLLTVALWLLGGGASARIHPVLSVYLLLAFTCGPLLVPRHILHWSRLVIGDLANAPPARDALRPGDSWYALPRADRHDAVILEPATEGLTAYTTGRQRPDRAWVTLDGLLRDRMPPLEDLAIGGHPGPPGAQCVLAAVLGGLILVNRGLIDLRIPLLALGAMLSALLLMPVPLVITEQGPQWTILALAGSPMEWSLAITFANYQALAGPAVFVVFFLATEASIRPMDRRSRTCFAIIVGVLIAACQLYVSAAHGACLAVLLAGMLTPVLDRWFAAKPLLTASVRPH